MASNELPDSNDRLFTLASDMIAGATTIGPATGVVQNTAAVLTTCLTAARKSEADFQKARQEKKDATSAQNIADSNTKAFIATAKRVLIPRLGANWSTAWAPVGYVDHSLATPTTLDERFNLLGTLRDYLAAHPAHENAPLAITAADAQALHAVSAAARSAVKEALKNLTIARRARETAMDALRIRMRGLVTELHTVLPDDDPRWYSFGLSAPADPETPGNPAAPTLTLGLPGSGLLFLDWPDTRRTVRYRVWQKLPGETAFRPVATVTESDATLTDLPLATPLEFQITAVNAAGESVPSPVSTIILS
jgi:hypothetical protein